MKSFDVDLGWRRGWPALLCLALALSLLLGISARPAAAIQAKSKVSQPAPMLGHVPEPKRPDSFTVTGAYFTPGGKVYLAIYDQVGQVLYENRWVHASKPTTAYEAGLLNNRGSQTAVPTPGGAIHETFDHLCGASAMIRGLDVVTARWTNWLSIAPACPALNAATVASDREVKVKLPVATDAGADSAFAISHRAIADVIVSTFPNPPMLLRVASDPAAPDVITVTGLDFTAGQRVYLAVYDQMGAKLYPNEWLTAAKTYTLESTDAASSQTPVISTGATGAFHVSFANLCRANLMIRAYDAMTETWSNWVDVNNLCFAGANAVPATPRVSTIR